MYCVDVYYTNSSISHGPGVFKTLRETREWSASIDDAFIVIYRDHYSESTIVSGYLNGEPLTMQQTTDKLLPMMVAGTKG